VPEQAIHVVIGQRNAPVRPIAPLASVSVNLDQAPDSRPGRNLTPALSKGEPHAVLVVWVVDQESLVEVRVGRPLDLDHAVHPFWRGPVPGMLLAAQAVRPQLSGEMEDDPAGAVERDTPPQLVHQDRRVIRAEALADGHVGPPPPLADVPRIPEPRVQRGPRVVHNRRVLTRLAQLVHGLQVAAGSCQLLGEPESRNGPLHGRRLAAAHACLTYLGLSAYHLVPHLGMQASVDLPGAVLRGANGFRGLAGGACDSQPGRLGPPHGPLPPGGCGLPSGGHLGQGHQLLDEPGLGRVGGAHDLDRVSGGPPGTIHVRNWVAGAGSEQCDQGNSPSRAHSRTAAVSRRRSPVV